MALATPPKPKTHHKKRQAKHHRQSKHYMKAYFPYLPMLLIVGIGLAINSLWASHGVLGAQSDFSSTTLLRETNIQRAAGHEEALTIDPELAAAAQAKANDMVAVNYWAHNSPDGKTPWSFIAGSGYGYQTAGENLAYGFDNATSTVIGWMNSDEHRANILNNAYQNVGFGVASSPNFQGQGPKTIVVAEYAQPVGAAANITFTVPSTDQNTPLSDVRGANTDLAAKPVSRIQLITGGKASWATGVVSAMAGAALALFLTRHGLRLRKVLVQGETFIAHHTMLDIIIVLFFTTAFVLTRASGIIG